MNSIKMVDLKSQYEKIKSEIDNSIKNVIDSTTFIRGAEVKEFEKELASYLNVKHVIACGNGTDALQIALMALNLEKGAEVIVPDFTFIATIEVISLLGFTPVITDVNPETYTIDIKDLKRKLSQKTKAIIPVHLFGQNCDMDEIMAIAKERNIFVIEDGAQSLGSVYHSSTELKSCTIGNIGCTSFFPSKNLGCFGDGGALMTNDDELAKKIRCIANHGMFTQYYHEMIGINSRLDTIQAAILIIKLTHLDEYNSARQTAANLYDSLLKSIQGLIIPKRSNSSSHIFHQYTLRVLNDKRDGLRKHLESKGIPSMIYYPVPLHMQQAFKSLNYKKGDFPITEMLSKEVLSLPMHTELTNEQIKYICTSIIEFYS